MLKRLPRGLGWLLAAALVAWLVQRYQGVPVQAAERGEPAQQVASQQSAPDAVRQAFQSGARDLWLDARGVVERNLADDRDGSRHQRFIIRTDGGISLLIAHNIDLAPRLEGLAVGDRIEARGEYVWNDKGGVLHWTHHDPAGRQAGGYILWKGRRYQ